MIEDDGTLDPTVEMVTRTGSVKADGYCDFDGNVVENSSRGSYTKVSPPRTVPDLYGYGLKVNVADGVDGYGQGSGSTYAAAYVAGIAALCAQALQIRGDDSKQLVTCAADFYFGAIRL
jgi:hypothetical protein